MSQRGLTASSLFFGLTLFGCVSGHGSQDVSDASAPEGPAVVSNVRASGRVSAMRARYVVTGLAGSRSIIAAARATRIAREGDRLVPDLDTPVHRAKVTLPSHANGETIVTVDDAVATIRALGASRAPAVVDSGAVAYENALPGGTIAHVPLLDGDQELVELAAPAIGGAARELRWDVELGGAVQGLRVVSNVVELLDVAGNPRIHATQPIVVDSMGVARLGALDVEGCAVDRDPRTPWGRAIVPPGNAHCTVVARFDDAGLAYPILIDPDWSSAGSMPAARTQHQAVFMQGGYVLVAGGLNAAGSVVASAAVYNQATNSWAATSSMASPRSAFGAVYYNSTVLVAGGWNGTASISAAERYTRSSGSWSSWGALSVARNSIAAVAITGDSNHNTAGGTSGGTQATYVQAIFAGGHNATTGWLGTVDSFENDCNGCSGGPNTSVWKVLPSLKVPRNNHAMGAVNLACGSGTNPCPSKQNFVVVGGQGASATYLSSVEYYSNTFGSTSTWTQGTPLATARGYGGAATQIDFTTGFSTGNFLFYAGGLENGGAISSEVDVVNMGTLTTTNLGSLNRPEYRLAAAFATYATGAHPVFIAGQAQSYGEVGVAFSNTSAGSIVSADTISPTRYSHTATALSNGDILVAGGQNSTSSALADAHLFNPANNGAACPSAATTGVDFSGSCNSGFCVDGVCCDSACAGQCQACNTYTGTTSNVGKCTTVTTTTFPKGYSAGQAVSGYGSTTRTLCAGYGATCGSECTGASSTTCSFAKSTVQCAAATCTTTTASRPAEFCDGTGNCNTVAAATCPSNFDCNTYGVSTSPGLCYTTCTLDSQCATGYKCSAGACVPTGAAGSACMVAGDCNTGLSCVDGTCCTSSSCPSGEHCNVSGFAGNCVLPFGTACTSANAAACPGGSADCVDGVCCNSTCSGQCQACDVSGSVGTCTTVLSGQPHGGRTACAGTGACQAQCDGSSPGACGNSPSTTTVCATASCTAGVQSDTSYCDGVGNCIAGALQSCLQYVCGATSCLTSCGTGADCASGYTCKSNVCVTTGANGTACTLNTDCTSGFCTDGVCCTVASCTAPQTCSANTTGTCSLPSGLACTSSSQCGSGYCVDGACCNTACAGQCQACDVSGSVGTCTTVIAGQPHGTRPQCSGAGVCQATCDGSSSATCGPPPGTSTTCQAASCTAGVQTATSYCNGLGACVIGAVQACVQYLCGPSACLTSCLSPTDCASGYTCKSGLCVTTGANGSVCALNSDCASGFCTNGACCNVASCTAPLVCDVNGVGTCSEPNGTACTSSSQCGSGNCADGVCCNAPCTGQCEACDVGGSIGTCSPVIGGQPHGTRSACTGTGLCRATCDGSSRIACGLPPGSGTTCAAASCTSGVQTSAGYCNGLGACAPGATQACVQYACGPTSCLTSCGAVTDCATGYTCKGGACVTTGSAGTLCSVGTDCSSGFCTDRVCCNVATCASGLVCGANTTGTCSKPKGATCASSTECGSGNCVDGVCCDKACSGECEACDVAGSIGACVAVSGAPHGARAACTGTGACQAKCDGSTRTACGVPPGPSTTCATPTCSTGVATPAAYCDGAGNCTPPTTTACAPYVCDTMSCKTVCTTAADCLTGYTCSSNACVPKKGVSCAAAADCASGFCVDGVCCDKACTGECEACDIAGAEGTCTAVTGAPHGTRAKCSDGGGDVCMALACDGSDHTKCAAYANGLDVVCKAASCASGTLTSAAHCDGKGACATGTKQSCSPYACDGAAACKTTCASNAECASGFFCAAGSCSAITATCSADGTQSIPQSGGAANSCAPYVCDTSNGGCFTQCTTSDQCSSSAECANGVCSQSPISSTTSSGGCSVEAAGSRSSGASSLLLALIGLAAARRRRSTPR